jgi:hypothetical protein
MAIFGEPELQWSMDGGKSWQPGTARVGEGSQVRIVAQDGSVMFQATAQSIEETCPCCDGKGKRTVYKYPLGKINRTVKKES